LTSKRKRAAQGNGKFLTRDVFAARRTFKKGVAALGITGDFTLYSLRRGGASELFRITNSMDRVLLNGRWESVKRARVYVMDGLAELTQIQLSPKANQTLSFYAGKL
jgi:hypothetical protein